MLSPTYVAPSVRPLAARASCHSLNHFGASHSAALSSLVPAWAALSAMLAANAGAATVPKRAFRKSRRLMSVPPTRRQHRKGLPAQWKRTSMSAVGHSRPNWAMRAMSGLPPLATELRTSLEVRFVPTTDLSIATQQQRRHSTSAKIDLLL